MNVPKILKSDQRDDYIVSTGMKGELEHGHLIYQRNGNYKVGEEEPVQIILKWRAGEDWQPYTGDPEPVLKLLREASQEKK